MERVDSVMEMLLAPIFAEDKFINARVDGGVCAIRSEVRRGERDMAAGIQKAHQFLDSATNSGSSYCDTVEPPPPGATHLKFQKGVTILHVHVDEPSGRGWITGPLSDMSTVPWPLGRWPIDGTTIVGKMSTSPVRVEEIREMMKEWQSGKRNTCCAVAPARKKVVQKAPQQTSQKGIFKKN